MFSEKREAKVMKTRDGEAFLGQSCSYCAPGEKKAENKMLNPSKKFKDKNPNPVIIGNSQRAVRIY